MPRPRKPARLTLRKDRDGLRRWVIRFGGIYVRTGIGEDGREAAESVLADYVAGRLGPSKDPGGGMVYYLSCAGETYPIKIGYCSGKVCDRIAQLQGGNPNMLVCLATERGSFVDEADIMRRFRHLHIRGEWFRRRARPHGPYRKSPAGATRLRRTERVHNRASARLFFKSAPTGRTHRERADIGMRQFPGKP